MLYKQLLFIGHSWLLCSYRRCLYFSVLISVVFFITRSTVSVHSLMCFRVCSFEYSIQFTWFWFLCALSILRLFHFTGFIFFIFLFIGQNFILYGDSFVFNFLLFNLVLNCFLCNFVTNFSFFVNFYFKNLANNLWLLGCDIF